MRNPTPPPKFGTVENGKYVWKQGKTLPRYYKNGEDFISIYLPQNRVGVHNFYGGDDEKFFEKNLKEQPNNWKYRNKEVTYTLNSYGYRSREFNTYDWSESIVLMGCSCTFGVGVSDEETLAYYLQQLTGREVINLGTPGGSNQFILDQSIVMKKKYGTPFALIMMWTLSDRLPHYGDDGVYHIGVWDSSENGTHKHAKKFKSLFDNTYEDDANEYIPLRNIVNTNRLIWEDKTKYTELSFFEQTSHYAELPDFIPFSNTARDLLHPGSSDFEETAKTLIKQINEKYGEDCLLSRKVGHNIKLL